MSRIAEAHQYLRQEDALGACTPGLASDAAAFPLPSPLKATAATARDAGPYAAAEHDSAAWGLEEWVKAPWSPGPYPGPPRHEPSSDDEDAAAARKAAWQAKPTRGRMPPWAKPRTADVTSRVPLGERYSAALERRAAGVATSYRVKVRDPRAAPPWWLSAGPPPAALDAQLFAAAAAAAAWERRHMPVVALPGPNDAGGDKAALAAAPHPFPPVASPRPPALPLPPASARAGKLTRFARSDDRGVLASAAAAGRARAATHARDNARRPLDAGDAAGSLAGSSPQASLARGGSRTALTLTSTREERLAAKAATAAAAAAQAQRAALAASAAAKRQRQVRAAYAHGVGDAVAQQHHALLRVLSHCASQPLARPQQLYF